MILYLDSVLGRIGKGSCLVMQSRDSLILSKQKLRDAPNADESRAFGAKDP